MNGWKPLIFLHEAEVDYDLVPISFAKRDQKSDWYLKLNPNGRIPTIVDTSNDDFVVFESGATYPWARSHFQATVSVDGLANLDAWFERIDGRPKTQQALLLPEPRPSAFGQGDVEAAARANAVSFKGP